MQNPFDNFEQKKVQEVKGSYYIYLPKDWCKKYQIGTQKRVFLKRMDDDTLIIKSKGIQAPDTLTYTINLDEDLRRKNGLTDDEFYHYLFNLYLTAYIIGYHRIKFVRRTKIPMSIQNRITAFTRTLHGMVIVSESKNEILIEDTSSNIDLRLAIKQILNKVGLMMNNIIELVEEYGEEHKVNKEIIPLLEELIKQDDQIDEHRYSIERQVHLILRYPSLEQKVGITSIECLHYAECTRLIERIGDYIIKIAVILKNEPVKEKKFVLEHLKQMNKIYTTIQDYFNRSDTLVFFRLIQEINQKADETKNLIINGHPAANYLSPIRRLQNICADIAEIRINDILSQSANGQ